MVFGVEDREDGDENFIKQLINDVGVIANIKFVTRIGDQSKKVRPIKVVLENSHQRYLVVYSLMNLKGKKVYQGVSIMEDYYVVREEHDQRVVGQS